MATQVGAFLSNQPYPFLTGYIGYYNDPYSASQKYLWILCDNIRTQSAWAVQHPREMNAAIISMRDTQKLPDFVPQDMPHLHEVIRYYATVHPAVKRKICKYDRTGNCLNGSYCAFAHQGELYRPFHYSGGDAFQLV